MYLEMQSVVDDPDLYSLVKAINNQLEASRYKVYRMERFLLPNLYFICHCYRVSGECYIHDSRTREEVFSHLRGINEGIDVHKSTVSYRKRNQE